MIVYVFSHSCVLQVSIIHVCCGNVVQDQNIKGKSNGGFVWWSMVERCWVQKGEFGNQSFFWGQEHSAYSTRRSRWANQGDKRESLVVLTLGRWFPVRLILRSLNLSFEPHTRPHCLWKQLLSISLSRRDLQVASERLRGLLNPLRRRIHGRLWLSHPRKCKTRWCQYVWLQDVVFVNASFFRIWLYRLALPLHLRLAKARAHQVVYRNSWGLYRLVDKSKGKNRV